MAGEYDELNLVFGDILTEARMAHVETQFKLARDRTRLLGGIPEVGVDDTSYVDLPGAVIAELQDDQNAKVHAMGFVTGGTGSLRLFDITAAGVVSSSEITFTSTSATLQKTPELTLLASHSYKVQIKISTSAQVVLVYGAQLVAQ